MRDFGILAATNEDISFKWQIRLKSVFCVLSQRHKFSYKSLNK